MGDNPPKNLIDSVQILQMGIYMNKVVSTEFNYEVHKELISMQLKDVLAIF